MFGDHKGFLALVAVFQSCVEMSGYDVIFKKIEIAISNATTDTVQVNLSICRETHMGQERRIVFGPHQKSFFGFNVMNILHMTAVVT